MSCFRLIQTAALLLSLLSMLVFPELSFGGSQAAAVATVQDDRTAEVNALIRDLRDPQFVVREAASQKLSEFGASAVAALKLAAQSDSLEVQTRAKSILASIQLDSSSRLSDSEQATVKQFVAADVLGRAAILREQSQDINTEVFLRLLDICVADEERAGASEDSVESAIEEWFSLEAGSSMTRWITDMLEKHRWEELNKLLTHPGILKHSPMLRAGRARNAGKFDAHVEGEYREFSEAQVAEKTLSIRKLVSLIGLLRVKRDFDRAEKVIAVLPDAELQRVLRKEILFQQGNWKEILRRTTLDPAAVEFISANTLQQVFLHHLLGDQVAIASVELDLRKQLQASIEVAGEENTEASRLIKSQLRDMAAVTLNWPLMKEFLDKDNLAGNVDLMAALNRHAEISELLGIGPRFIDRKTWVTDTLKEFNEAKETLKNNPRGRRDPEYDGLIQLISEKQKLLDSVVDMFEQWGLDDEAQLYCQMIYASNDSHSSILERLVELGRTKEYWQLVESLLKVKQRDNSGRSRFGITDDGIEFYADQWASKIRGVIVDPFEEAKTIAAIMNSPLIDREGMDFDLDYEIARLRTQTTMDSSGRHEFLIGKVLELHGKDEAADSLLKQAAQLGHAAAIDAEFVQAMVKEDLYGIAKGGSKTDKCLLAEEAALKILETETDPEKIRLVKQQLSLCHLMVAAQWMGGSDWALRSASHIENLNRPQLASLHLQCLAYGVSGDFVDKERLSRQLGNVLLAEGSDRKQHGAIELATVMFDELGYSSGDQPEIFRSFSSIYFNVALGKGMIERKEYDRAVDLLVRTADFSLGDVSVGEDTIKVLAEAGAIEEADQIYQAIGKYYVETLKDFPDSPLARNNFAWLSAISNRDLESARRHASVAVKVRPHVENYWDTFAEIEFLLGNPKEAFELSKRCIQLSPGRFYYRKQKERFRRAMGEAE